MKFTLNSPFRKNIYNLMREIGYHFLKRDEKSGELNFVRLLERGGYPRFHIYLKMENLPRTKFTPSSNSAYNYQTTFKDKNLVRGKNLVFNLHLDQKRPIYKGAPAHSGEYEGKVVEKEAERIKKILQQNAKN